MQIVVIGWQPWSPDSHPCDPVDARGDGALEIASGTEPHPAGADHLAAVPVVGFAVAFVIYRCRAERPEEWRHIPLLGGVLDEYVRREPVELGLNGGSMSVGHHLDGTTRVVARPVIAQHRDDRSEVRVQGRLPAENANRPPFLRCFDGILDELPYLFQRHRLIARRGVDRAVAVQATQVAAVSDINFYPVSAPAVLGPKNPRHPSHRPTVPPTGLHSLHRSAHPRGPWKPFLVEESAVRVALGIHVIGKIAHG